MATVWNSAALLLLYELVTFLFPTEPVKASVSLSQDAHRLSEKQAMRSLIDDPQWGNLCASTSRQDWNEQTMSDYLRRETRVELRDSTCGS